jgi:hypothetical protein
MARKKRPETALYFTTVVAAEDHVAIIGGHLYSENDEPSTTRISVCDRGSWGDLGDLDEIVYAIAKKPGLSPKSIPTICIMGREGTYRELVTKIPPVETVIDTVDSGFLLALKYIGNHLYTCGTQNQVLKQVGGNWIKIDQSIYSPLEDEVDRSLNAIDGFSDEDIYAVGDEGKIFHWNGKGWSSVISPTNLSLYSILCTSINDIYIAGAGGLVFKYTQNENWIDLSDAEITSESIESIAEYKGSIYVACHEALLRVDGDKLSIVDVSLKGKHSYDALSSNSDVLWCVGDESVLVFDGATWNEYICPDNE